MRKRVTRKQNQQPQLLRRGVMNDMGLKAAFYELEDGTLAALISPLPQHQSYPQRVHGGVITAMLDETIGRAINITEPDTWGVTRRYQHPLQKTRALRRAAAGHRAHHPQHPPHLRRRGRALFGRRHALRHGKARYVKQPLNVIGDLESNGDFWRCFPSEDDPEEIDIP